MKTLFIVFGWMCVTVSGLFAQTPQQAENDLVKSFKKIDYWYGKAGDAASADSLVDANNVFAQKLKHYADAKPALLSYPFGALVKEHVAVLTSADNQFRIFSWDTQMGGTMHAFENVLQYKQAGKVNSVIDTAKDEEQYIYSYDNLYTLKAGNKTYYLATYMGVYSSKDVGRGITIFGIENGKLNTDVKLIKTASGLHGHLYYDYDFLSVVDLPFSKRPTITYDAATKTIKVPLVAAGGKVTKNFIIYKFNGQYFEKVKS